MLRFTSLLFTVLAILLAAPGVASPEAGLGSEGELYVVREGTHGDLFPDDTEAEEDSWVLALDVVRKGEGRERHLVPGTEGAELESAPSLKALRGLHALDMQADSARVDSPSLGSERTP